MKECPKGDAFAAFVNPMVMFCFDQSCVPLTGWEMLTKAMEKSGSYPITNRKVVASYNTHHSHWFSAEGKMAVADKTLPAFASKKKWQGMGGMDGQHAEIKLLLDTSTDGVQTAIKDKLPAGSQLGQLALRMLDHRLSWFLTKFNHLDSEFVHLTQVNISEEDTLILLSEEVIIMLDRFPRFDARGWTLWSMDCSIWIAAFGFLCRFIWSWMSSHRLG
jgi:hypothetical protein